MQKRKTTKPAENPQWTETDFKKATHLPGTSLVKAVAAARRGRGPQKAPKKVAISIRLHPDIVKHFKSGGAGWQARMEVALMNASSVKKSV